MARTNQGGSILGFAIIAGVMALLLVAGVYVVRHQLASQSQGAPVPEEQIDDGSSDASTGTDTSRPVQDAPVADTKQPEQTASPDHSPEDLPQTGPADIILSTIAVGAIVGAIVAYMRSRDTVASL